MSIHHEEQSAIKIGPRWQVVTGAVVDFNDDAVSIEDQGAGREDGRSAAG